MQITGYEKSRTFKTVRFENVIVGTTDTALLKAALEKAGETHHSIFDYFISRPSVGKAVVTLCTD